MVKIVNKTSLSKIANTNESFSGGIFKGNDFPLLNCNKIYAERLSNQNPKTAINLTDEPDSDASNYFAYCFGYDAKHNTIFLNAIHL